jgi:signal transduction histidine kinase
VLNLLVQRARRARGPAERGTGGRIDVDSVRARRAATGVVEDDGPGVPPDSAALADLFFTTKEVGKGTGWASRSCTTSSQRTAARALSNAAGRRLRVEITLPAGARVRSWRRA